MTTTTQIDQLEKRQIQSSAKSKRKDHSEASSADAVSEEAAA
jgi:hypothetical protein